MRPNTGTLKRLLTTLIEGASLGTIDYQPHAAATGYLAFLTVVLYLTGLALLPAAGARVNMRALQRAPSTDLVLLLLACGALGLTASGCGGSSSKETAGSRRRGSAGGSPPFGTRVAPAVSAGGTGGFRGQPGRPRPLRAHR